MGSFNFKWEHPAEDVYVTGTFDSWTKSEKLEKNGNIFEKTVILQDVSDKIYYKFVVDGYWCTDHTALQENDKEGNPNNVLTPEQITKHTPASEAIMSSVTAESTTATLAGEVPLEVKPDTDLPGTFPETPETEPLAFSVNPIPATEGLGNPIKLAPGEPVPDPSTLTQNTVSSTVHDDLTLINTADDSQQKFSVNPIPATAGDGNPIKLAPGEKVPDPSDITSNTVESTVRTDKESYENSDALGVPPVLPPVTIPEARQVEEENGVLDLPPVSKNMIPESSLPIGMEGAGTFDASPHIQSVGPESTTAQLAAKVPLEPKEPSVPNVVKENQGAAGVEPEANAVSEEVQEKKVVEELLNTVPEVPVTSDNTNVAAKDDTEITKFSTNGAVAPAVPEPVKESLVESGLSPEAIAISKPVKEEEAAEKDEAKPEDSNGDPTTKTADAAAALSPPEVSSVVTTGVESTATDKIVAAPETPTTSAASAAPSSSKAIDGQSPASPAATDKKKRISFFGKLRDKFSEKRKH